MNYEETRYGFNYGSAVVERVTHDEKKGTVVIGVFGVHPITEKRTDVVYVRVTASGRIQVTNEHGGELTVAR